MSSKESNTIKKKQYMCSVDGCNSVYKKPCMLQVHMRKHTGERPFVCDFPGCSLSYTNICHLKRHICLVHEKSSDVLCKAEGCGQVFNNKYALKKHYNRKHKTGHEYNCPKCSLHFKRKKLLQEHDCGHKEAEAPFRCSLCNLVFKKFHLYNKHKRNHRTYTCDCGVVFDKWTLFCEHRRTSCHLVRVDHKCVICNKIFTTKTNLRVHALTHLEESQLNVYRCPFINCTRSYKYKKNLTFHINMFHEKCDKSVQCTKPGCGTVLKTKRLYDFHLLKMHGSVPKKKKDRTPRHDKGKHKKCMASILSGIELSSSEPLAITSESGNIQNTINSSTTESAQVQLDNIENVSVTSHNIKESQGSCNSEITKQNTLPITSETENFTDIQIDLKRSIPLEAEENHSVDDVLLEYCDSVLKTLKEHLNELPNRNSHHVY